MRKELMTLACVLAAAGSAAQNADEFRNPPAAYRPVPLWFWNNTPIERTEAAEQFRTFTQRDGYGGCAILPFGGHFAPEYLSDEYFALYGEIVREAREAGLVLSLYDEYGFPSGSMGAINGDGTPRFMQRHPEATIKRLDKFEYPLAAGTECDIELPRDGRLMALVAMDSLTREVRPLSGRISSGRIRWTPPQGTWKLLCFMCVKDGDPNVDYLDPDAVRLFVEDTHQRYYDRFPEAFGEVITETFCDEPTLYRAQGRIWTERFNERFEAAHGFSPEALYPALWYDTGPGTAAARNYLFGFRARLYAEGFMKTIHDWAAAHGIRSTGHQDQEEVLNPVSVAGDLMLCGKYMDVPGIDKIGGDRPAELFYKVVSSSAANWDKRLVMSETFGAMGNIPVRELYTIAMEQYTKGINQLIPHAVWYNDADVTFLPELSYRNPLYNEALPAFNRFLARLNYLLQPEGRTVADIAMLYPIETLQAGHYLDGPEGYYAGGVKLPGTDYIRVAAMLSDTLARDFTYLHPEVLAHCPAGRGMLHLDNKVNHQHYRVLILPGVKCISPECLRTVERFRRAGGRVIFTTALPETSTRFEVPATQVAARVQEMLTARKNPALFLPEPDTESLRKALEADFIPDVTVSGAPGLRYIHRICGGRHIYYFANIGTETAEAGILLRDAVKLRSFDPHTGDNAPFAAEVSAQGTRLQLTLPGARSLFLVSE